MNIKHFTSSIYEKDLALRAYTGLESLLEKHRPALKKAQEQYSKLSPTAKGIEALPWNETDSFIITYGDTFLPGAPPSDPEKKRQAELGIGGGVEMDGSLHAPAPESERSLRALQQFANRYLNGIVSGIHILPFFPYSSDDGFSIIDYYEVNPALGEWDDISKIAANFRFMADLVLNHCSAKGPWFKAFLAGDEKYQGYFIDLPADSDVSEIVRPRTLPLLSPFTGQKDGKPIERHIWTTFSADQVDLNFAHPELLIQMIDVILFLIEKGAQVIRLDAIAYLWKELGTPSIHHSKTHLVVQLYRHILDAVAPWVILITETNVPHEENMSYFGEGNDEAHIIYQFSLPPLLLDAFLRGSANHLSAWAQTIPSGAPGPIGYTSTYFNFCASHDGIGVTPAHGILNNEELENLYAAVEERGGHINYKATPSGKIPYELNINYFSAIAERTLPQALRIKKFLASQAILLSLAGVPGIYIHSLIASENWKEGIALTGANRSINRQKLFLSEVMAELDDPESLRHAVFTAYLHMIELRRNQKAFHPAAKQTVLNVGAQEIFAFLREAPESSESHPEKPQRIICLINTSASRVKAVFKAGDLAPGISVLHDILSNRSIDISQSGAEKTISLEPWEAFWLV